MSGGGDAIVVTGMGTIGSSGLGGAALLTDLRRGETRVTEIDRSGGFHGERAARTALLVGQLSVADWIRPLVARRMSAPSRYAVVAAKMALHECGLEIGADEAAQTGVAIATAFGPPRFTQRLVDQILDEGPGAASPSVFTECVANAPAGQVAIHCTARGPNYTLSNREAGPLLALARGFEDLRNERAGIALAGAVEEMPPLLHAILDRFGALARRDENGLERARPFDRRRCGFVAAEGATMLVLERLSAAERRDARPLARVCGWGAAFDATATSAGWGRGSAVLGRALRRCIERAGFRPEQIDLIVSGASGSRAGDRLEAASLREAWQETPLPAIVAPKSITGEYGGGFLAAAVLAAAGQDIGGTAGFELPDPAIDLVPGRCPPDVRRVLVTTLASGGAAAWVLLERP